MHHEQSLFQTLGIPALNLLILIVILVTKLRGPIKDFVHNRHIGVRDEVKRVRDMLRDAQTKYDEFTSKLRAFEAEAVAIRQQMQQDGQNAKQRILTEAQRLSGSIVSDARLAAQNLYSDLRGQLMAEIGNRIIDRAEVMLKERLTGEDRARLQAEFSTQVEGVK